MYKWCTYQSFKTSEPMLDCYCTTAAALLSRRGASLVFQALYTALSRRRRRRRRHLYFYGFIFLPVPTPNIECFDPEILL
jgi:hypothetical protein